MSADPMEVVEAYGRYRVDGSLGYAEGNALWTKMVDEVRRMRDERLRLINTLKLVRPAMASLMDEVTGEGSTKWGLVNDCLFAVGVVMKAVGEP